MAVGWPSGTAISGYVYSVRMQLRSDSRRFAGVVLSNGSSHSPSKRVAFFVNRRHHEQRNGLVWLAISDSACGLHGMGGKHYYGGCSMKDCIPYMLASIALSLTVISLCCKMGDISNQRDSYKALYEASTNKEASVRKVLVYSVKKCPQFAYFLQDVLQRKQDTRVALLRKQ